jgi:hypothetical protein
VKLICAALGGLFIGASGTMAFSPSKVTGQTDDLQSVPLVQLMANPNSYHGKRLMVIGYAHIEFEGHGLYLHREDYRNGTGNVLWIGGGKVPLPNQLALNDKFVMVVGTWNAERRGHMGMFIGEIEKIESYELWSDPKKPRSPDPGSQYLTKPPKKP